MPGSAGPGSWLGVDDKGSLCSYRYVAAALVSSVWVVGWQITVVSRYRLKSGIKYPQLYVEKVQAEASREAHLFNCAQRAHQCTLEYMPIILVSGMKYPVFAASACGFWAFSCVLYTIGYTTGDAAKRNTRGGVLGHIPLVGLFFGSTYVAYQLLVGA